MNEGSFVNPLTLDMATTIDEKEEEEDDGNENVSQPTQLKKAKTAVMVPPIQSNKKTVSNVLFLSLTFLFCRKYLLPIIFFFNLLSAVKKESRKIFHPHHQHSDLKRREENRFLVNQ